MEICKKKKKKERRKENRRKGMDFWRTIFYETRFRGEQKCKLTRTKNSPSDPE
jgi:hypothetical protein